MELVFIPCTMDGTWFDAPVIVKTADGGGHRLLANRLDIVDGRLCVIALRIEERDGLHLVRFRDESECWVRPSPEWVHTPADAEPVRVPEIIRQMMAA
ncbi:hypothetical protein [Zavarzinella formosa]|uniref:hypothetical protein n=1 Tax=Zavarzinella formosa TaxID=360055 RepID=UPI0002EFCD6D|nr:hypothetical protein [Zavarzinella formosa]